MNTAIKEVRLYYETTLGTKSHLNLFGKILLFPLIVTVGASLFVLTLLFTKKT